ncbi:MAG: squalene/phytoene synthase family protein [Planctomycetes bacterium]|nr:squalene/phytoene synthase family protein [Planctomycetota bacterium]
MTEELLDDRWRALLRATSRSFYLSLRCVPARRRTALSLGYLLARAADTLADAGELALEQRAAALRALLAALRGAPLPAAPPIAAVDAAHRELVARAPELFALLARLEPAQRAPTQRVLARLLRGMCRELDELHRVGVVRRSTSVQTLCWAYRAAGCVGAFWDELLALERPPRSPRTRREQRRQAVRLGLGLQQVNLLRDAHEDARRSRHLLAGLALDGSTPDVERAWTARARADLRCGLRYAGEIDGVARRDRFAIALPARLGLATLGRLEERRPQWLAGERLKISRGAVRRELALAFLDALFPARLRRFDGSGARSSA